MLERLLCLYDTVMKQEKKIASYASRQSIVVRPEAFEVRRPDVMRLIRKNLPHLPNYSRVNPDQEWAQFSKDNFRF